MILSELKGVVIDYLKSNMVVTCLLIIIVILTTTYVANKSHNNFILIKTDKRVKIEVYDICLDKISSADSCAILNTLQDVEFKPKPIKYLALHCTASSLPKRPTTKKDWEYFFFNEKYPGTNMVGYNYIIDIDKVISLKPLNSNKTIDKSELVWGVAGFNSQTVSIAYIGGIVVSQGKLLNVDTRTPRQKVLLDSMVNVIVKIANPIIIRKHREFPNVHKTCPNFDKL